MPPLTVIEASAGTGKTFALVTRLLLLIFAGTPPERIVALTFSRLAAGEIFNSFIERLARAAGNERVAAEEAERLGFALSAADFRAKLRLVIMSQHLSLIGTLDSFLMRVVRILPFELGLDGELSVMSDYRSPVERLRLVGEMMMLSSEDAKAVFRDAFRLAFGTPGTKGFVQDLSSFIDDWHVRYRDLPDPLAWGRPDTIWGENPPADLDVTLAAIRKGAEALAPLAEKRGVATFLKAVSDFSGSMPSFPKVLEGNPVAERLLRLMRTWKIARNLAATQGVWRLMHTFETVYAAKVRQRGLVTFDDLPRLLNALPEGVRLPLEYRMDARFDHWALDEFQDTSGGQWRAIRNLIYENSGGDSDKSVFIVGDRKQSIYEWRGGDVRILGEQVARAAEHGNRLQSLDVSYRYLPVISDAVNRVFGEDVVRGAFDMDDAPEGAKWYCRPHESKRTSPTGFVEVVQATKRRNLAAISDFFEPVANALSAVRPWERGITTAILVRKNSYGEALLADLKARGIDRVVFEGDCPVFDSPVLSALVELVKLAEHPDDAFAYAHLRHSPLAAALWPEGLPDAATLSSALLADFTRKGMVRVFREAREALKVVPESWNEFTESRFADFIKCVAEFEELRDSSLRLSDFIEYLRRRTRRDYAEPGMVRILTMHQSKGLGFDHVILPLFEPEGLVGARHIGPLESEAPPWLLENPSPVVALSDPVLAAAERRRQQVQRYNALCLYYVAMTRAKSALTLVLHPQNKTDKPTSVPERFSDLVRMVSLKTAGDPAWYRAFVPAPPPAAEAPRAVPARTPRHPIAKLRPSEAFFSGLRADRLFDEDFGAAAKRGSAVHELLARIEWAEGEQLAALPADWREAFERPSADAEVWRERSYELFDGRRWESGQFDRVVFTGSGESRRATIYDFKTSAPRPDETPAAFAERLNAHYATQLAAYRNALGRLTAIPPDRIATRLLFCANPCALGGNYDILHTNKFR